MSDYRKIFEERKAHPLSYPPDHEMGLVVPRGGSMCANCKFLTDDKENCKNEYFIKWNGSEKLPAPANRYCCDQWEADRSTADAIRTQSRS